MCFLWRSLHLFDLHIKMQRTLLLRSCVNMKIEPVNHINSVENSLYWLESKHMYMQWRHLNNVYRGVKLKIESNIWLNSDIGNFIWPDVNKEQKCGCSYRSVEWWAEWVFLFFFFLLITFHSPIDGNWCNPHVIYSHSYTFIDHNTSDLIALYIQSWSKPDYFRC